MTVETLHFFNNLEIKYTRVVLPRSSLSIPKPGMDLWTEREDNFVHEGNALNSRDYSATNENKY